MPASRERASEVSLPAELRSILDQLDAGERDAQALLADLDDEQLRWQPAPTAWGIGQCMDHVTAANAAYLVPIGNAVAAARASGARPRGPLRPGLPARWFLRTLEPPPRRRLRSPGKIVPVLGKSKAQVAGEFADVQQRVRDLVRAAAGIDLNRTRFVNPFVPLLRFSVGTGFLVIAAHERRHLFQAAAVRRHPSFPPAGRPSS